MKLKDYLIENIIIMSSYNVKKAAENLLDFEILTGNEITLEDVKELTNDINDIEAMKEAIRIRYELAN